jgi:hypothetical protein
MTFIMFLYLFSFYVCGMIDRFRIYDCYESFYDISVNSLIIDIGASAEAISEVITKSIVDETFLDAEYLINQPYFNN